MKIFWFKRKIHSWSVDKKHDLASVLKRGGVAVMPTDTTYGIVGSALNEKTVNEIYRLRKRDLDKPFIVLIADRKDLKKFGVKLTPAQEKILDRVWPKTISSDEIVRPTDSNRFRPSPTSVILPCVSDRFAYLHRGKNTLAFRLPEKESLRALLRESGPLVAPSANPQGHPVAKNISEARAYFGHHARPVRGREGSPHTSSLRGRQRVFDSNGVDFYQDGGTITALPSKLIDITEGAEKVIRA